MQSYGNSIPVLRGASVASIGMGFFSLVVFWWYPFALILSSAGLAIALFCMFRKVRGIHGENLALIGATICGIVVSVIVTLTQLLHIVMWDH
jgi:hypothetical protein